MMLGKAIKRNSAVLAIFAIACAGILALTEISTADRIEEQIRKAEEKALLEIIPAERHNNQMLNDTVILTQEEKRALNLKKKKHNKVYIAKQDGKPVAAIIPSVAPDGYSGRIVLLIGINIDGTIAAVRAVDHKETPGLGDQVDKKKTDWVDAFIGKSLSNTPKKQWRVKKNGGIFDSFTGATITPKAITRQVHRTLIFFEENQAHIFPSLHNQADAPAEEMHHE